MEKLRVIKSTIHRNLLFWGGICLCLYFSYHTVSGHRSYARLSELTAIAQEKEQKLNHTRAEKHALERRVKMLRPETLSIDLLEERARYILGYTRQNEIMILAAE